MRNVETHTYTAFKRGIYLGSAAYRELSFEGEHSSRLLTYYNTHNYPAVVSFGLTRLARERDPREIPAHSKRARGIAHSRASRSAE